MNDERTLSDKLSGRFRHPEDTGARSILTGRLLRAPSGPGRISSIELPESPPGVVSFVNKDIPGSSRIGLGGTTVPVLSGRDILWPGQEVLAAAGPDAAELDDWLSRIRIDFNQIPVEDPTGTTTQFAMDRGDVAAAFSSSFQVIEETFHIPAGHSQGEARHITCIRDGSTYGLHLATSWPGAVRRSVSRVLKTDRNNIRVRPYPQNPSAPVWRAPLDACRTALLARAARKSVRLSISASESALIDSSSPAADFHIRGGVDSEGRILALDVVFELKTGYFLPMEQEYLDRVIMGLFSVYPCRNYTIRGTIRRLDEPPSAHGTAIGFELGFLAGELFASRVAEHSLVPPGAWRQQSLPVAGQPFGPGLTLPREFPLPRILGKAIGLSDFERKYASYEQTRLAGRNLDVKPEQSRGIGLSCAWFGNGFVASPKELGGAIVNITLDKEGFLTIDIPVHTAGPALLRAWAGMAGEILGLNTNMVLFPQELGAGGVDPGPSIFGRNVSVYTKLIELACNDLAKRRFRDALPITASRSRRRSTRQPWNPDAFEGAAFENISWGTAVVEVEHHAASGRIVPTRVVLVVDGGRLLMAEHARAAVETSIQNALSWCLGSQERRTLPLLEVHFHESTGKRPAKDVSTIPWLTVPAACIQAARQAGDVDIDRVPVGRLIARIGE